MNAFSCFLVPREMSFPHHLVHHCYTGKQQQFPPAEFTFILFFLQKWRASRVCSLPVSLFPLKKIKMIESWDVHYTFKGRSPNNPLESHEIFSCIQVRDNSNPTVAKQAVGGKREFLGVVLPVPRWCLDWRWDSSQSVWLLGKILSLQQEQGLKSTGVAQWFLHPAVKRWDPWASPFSHFPLVFWESSSMLPEPEGPWEQSWWI